MNFFDRKWRLCACRVQAGYSQKEACELIGVSETTIVAWETGKKSPSIENAQKLSELYMMPLVYIDFSKEGNRVPLRYRAFEVEE